MPKLPTLLAAATVISLSAHTAVAQQPGLHADRAVLDVPDFQIAASRIFTHVHFLSLMALLCLAPARRAPAPCWVFLMFFDGDRAHAEVPQRGFQQCA